MFFEEFVENLGESSSYLTLQVARQWAFMNEIYELDATEEKNRFVHFSFNFSNISLAAVFIVFTFLINEIVFFSSFSSYVVSSPQRWNELSRSTLEQIACICALAKLFQLIIEVESRLAKSWKLPKNLSLNNNAVQFSLKSSLHWPINFKWSKTNKIKIFISLAIKMRAYCSRLHIRTKCIWGWLMNEETEKKSENDIGLLFELQSHWFFVFNFKYMRWKQ